MGLSLVFEIHGPTTHSLLQYWILQESGNAIPTSWATALRLGMVGQQGNLSTKTEEPAWATK